MPDRLRDIMIASGTTLLETAVALETNPEIRKWKWYGGALQQYHTAFLLLMEIYVNPQRKEADRIWACLDYIFECDPAESRNSKGRRVLSELQQKTAVYQQMRGMRAPVQMNKHGGKGEPRVSDNNKEQLDDMPAGLRYMSPRRESEPSVPPAAPSVHNSGGLKGASVPSIGRAPLLSDVHFAGSANGVSIWAPPNSQSPEASSDSASLPSQTRGQDLVRTDDLMSDIDWVSYVAFSQDLSLIHFCRTLLMPCSRLTSKLLIFRHTTFPASILIKN